MPPKYFSTSTLMNGFLFYLLQNFNYHTTGCSPGLTCLERRWKAMVLGCHEGDQYSLFGGHLGHTQQNENVHAISSSSQLELYVTEIFPLVCKDTYMHVHACAHTYRSGISWLGQTVVHWYCSATRVKKSKRTDVARCPDVR